MKKQLLTYDKNNFFLDGKPFFLASGDMHYFRHLRGGWLRRLQLMKDFGLTCVQTYVPWNLHEPEEGMFCFEKQLDLCAFLELCQTVGLKVLLRPSPYICAEWDFGGLPYWLLNKEDVCIRTLNPTYMDCVRKYYQVLCAKFVPYLSTNGGPIIAVGVENEYGSFSNDTAYMAEIGRLLQALGVNVPLYTSNGADLHKFYTGSNPKYLTTLDLHMLGENAKACITQYQPNKPIFVSEFWGGRSQQQGAVFVRQPAESVAEHYKNLLQNGAYANIYMFVGGSNFGFMNGAVKSHYQQAGVVEDYPFGHHDGEKYIPFAQSYDVDAPINEQGQPTEKYYALKRVLKAHLENKGFPFGGTDDLSPAYQVPTQSIQKVTLRHCGNLLADRDALCTKKAHAARPLTFEKMGQAYGYMLYTTQLPYISDCKMQLVIDGLQDYATIYGNGQYLGTYMRDRICQPIYFYIPKEGLQLDILVENCGRINYGAEMLFENKGILRYVKAEMLKPDGSFVHNFSFLANWDHYALPMTVEKITASPLAGEWVENTPSLYTGTFTAQAGVDTFLSLDNLHKGAVYINGFHLGRFWGIGSQRTLYVPGELIKETNTITVFELYAKAPCLDLHFTDKPNLNGKGGTPIYKAIGAADKRSQIG